MIKKYAIAMNNVSMNRIEKNAEKLAGLKPLHLMTADELESIYQEAPYNADDLKLLAQADTMDEVRAYIAAHKLHTEVSGSDVKFNYIIEADQPIDDDDDDDEWLPEACGFEVLPFEWEAQSDADAAYVLLDADADMDSVDFRTISESEMFRTLEDAKFEAERRGECVIVKCAAPWAVWRPLEAPIHMM